MQKYENRNTLCRVFIGSLAEKLQELSIVKEDRSSEDVHVDERFAELQMLVRVIFS